MWPDEALEPSLDRWPFDPHAAERIGTVENEHLKAARGRSLEAIQRSKRQLAALINDLRLLDRDVLSGARNTADNLQKALDATVVQLGNLAEVPALSAPGVLDRMLAASDAALRDSCYEAAMLLTPSRRRA